MGCCGHLHSAVIKKKETLPLRGVGGFPPCDAPRSSDVVSAPCMTGLGDVKLLPHLPPPWMVHAFIKADLEAR